MPSYKWGFKSWGISMNEYATEIRIRFYDDIGIFKVEELFEALQNLKARDYLKLYQMIYQDLIEHQQLNYFEKLKDNLESKGDE